MPQQYFISLRTLARPAEPRRSHWNQQEQTCAHIEWQRGLGLAPGLTEYILYVCAVYKIVYTILESYNDNIYIYLFKIMEEILKLAWTSDANHI